MRLCCAIPVASSLHVPPDPRALVASRHPSRCRVSRPARHILNAGLCNARLIYQTDLDSLFISFVLILLTSHRRPFFSAATLLSLSNPPSLPCSRFSLLWARLNYQSTACWPPSTRFDPPDRARSPSLPLSMQCSNAPRPPFCILRRSLMPHPHQFSSPPLAPAQQTSQLLTTCTCSCPQPDAKYLDSSRLPHQLWPPCSSRNLATGMQQRQGRGSSRIEKGTLGILDAAMQSGGILAWLEGASSDREDSSTACKAMQRSRAGMGAAEHHNGFCRCSAWRSRAGRPEGWRVLGSGWGGGLCYSLMKGRDSEGHDAAAAGHVVHVVAHCMTKKSGQPACYQSQVAACRLSRGSAP